MILHATCSKCGSHIGKYDKKKRYLKCKICKTKVDVKDKSYKNFFVMLDFATPISKLIEANSDYHNYVVNNRIPENGRIRDIHDGQKYREFVASLNETDRHRYATVIFNTDGAPLFESSSSSIWPIFLMVNEVPFPVRTEELVLAGLWFGKDKPDMNVFLDPYVVDMNLLSTNGVDCTINGEKTEIKVFHLVSCVDSVARAPVQGHTQFNGAYGCGQCLHQGEYVKNNPNNPRSGNIKYPLMSEVPKQRNVKDTIRHKKHASPQKPVFGVKCPSPLINLLRYDIINGCIIEPLHCLSGIAKQFATAWFGTLKKAGLLPKSKIDEIDEKMTKIKAPNQISQLTRGFSEKTFWKAREWENWTVYYSMVVLQDILPDALLMHWALFVEAFYILTKHEIRIEEVDFSDKLLYEFVGHTQLLYSEIAMTFNVHLLLHLAKSVLFWGPLWCHDAYGFESGNGDLLKVVHAAKGIHSQICRRISLKYSFNMLRDRIYSASSCAVKNYCDTLGTRMAKKCYQTANVRYFGPSSPVDLFWKEKLNLPDRVDSYRKIVKNGCLNMSMLKSNNRSNNSYAQLKNGIYVKLNSFIFDSRNEVEYSIVQVIDTENAFNVYRMLQKIAQISDEQSAVLTDDIEKVCVVITYNDVQYLCSVPNLWHY